jgi:hypothetical protein
MLDSIFEQNRAFFITHSQLLLHEYSRRIGAPLLEPESSPEATARLLWEADFPILSAGAEEDPLLNYANRCALQLWKLPATALGTFPARLTAEPAHRAARAEFLRQVRLHGFVTNYEGIRISTTGERFAIQAATVWNLEDVSGKYVGQAATFRQWQTLPPSSSVRNLLQG